MKFSRFSLVLILFLILPQISFAQSNYVLPYPSFMPGNKFYKISLIWDEIKKYWYFGDFGQFKYNLSQSDKHLVEARTLFDYKQYLLALSALEKSDMYFGRVFKVLVSAKSNNKNVFEKEILLKEASQKHFEELKKIRGNVPEVFEWRPEKESPTILNLWEIMDDSIEIRQKIL